MMLPVMALSSALVLVKKEKVTKLAHRDRDQQGVTIQLSCATILSCLSLVELHTVLYSRVRQKLVSYTNYGDRMLDSNIVTK